MDLTTIIIAVASLIVGLLAGSLLTKTLSPAETRRRELEEKFRQKEDELKVYQKDVSDHFVKTSELLRTMNETQREIGEQLATGAMRLASPEASRQVQSAAFSGLSHDGKPQFLSHTPPEAPKDYAPSVPGGVLSESYGLSEIPNERIQTVGLTATRDEKTGIRTNSDDDPTLNIS